MCGPEDSVPVAAHSAFVIGDDSAWWRRTFGLSDRRHRQWVVGHAVNHKVQFSPPFAGAESGASEARYALKAGCRPQPAKQPVNGHSARG